MELEITNSELCAFFESFVANRNFQIFKLPNFQIN